MLQYIFEPESVSRTNLISCDFHVRPQKHKLVEDLCSIHSDICDICTITEEYFAIKLLSIVGTGFVYILFNSYYGFTIIFMKPLDNGNSKVLTYLVIQLILVSLGIILTCNSGHNICSQV